MLFQLAAAFNVEEPSLFGVGSASALALLGFLLTCRAYKTKFTAGGKLFVRYGLDKARANLKLLFLGSAHPRSLYS